MAMMPPEQLDVLRTLLTSRRVLALAVVADGEPIIGLLPYALTRDARALVVHASRMARHTRGLLAQGAFDALIHEPDLEGVDPMQVQRVTLRGRVRAVAQDDPDHVETRAVYLAKFPDAEPITALGDFGFYRLEIEAGRLVTGFAGAANVTQDVLGRLASTGRE
jgi:putative heme iron utilization protein